MVTDLVQIGRLGEKQREQNLQFRAWLKRHKFVERRLVATAQDVSDAIDCSACANCCRVATTQVTERDVVKMARHVGMSPSDFRREYVVEPADEGPVLKRTADGCVFLVGKLCSIYEGRPAACELFPHLVKGNGSLLSRMWHMPDRAVYCPIVFNSLERFKSETGFHS